ncbi:hypothetical protein, conserved [Eimeria tenella]|uniref:RRM domain-containing protein n=1 Tax=Eimeria tenella TaxID=5802 RepID=U6KTZ7_EIMTE|nr:hypothetical protein, conserved [Eimeria tenella]CDJ38950.1 hypothetical protein, conserved [Eimeria tenella]|eukprot:XP_013229705.1 hypothetical protein, conserved [Eimeria tenella]
MVENTSGPCATTNQRAACAAAAAAAAAAHVTAAAAAAAAASAVAATAEMLASALAATAASANTQEAAAVENGEAGTPVAASAAAVVAGAAEIMEKQQHAEAPQFELLLPLLLQQLQWLVPQHQQLLLQQTQQGKAQQQQLQPQKPPHAGHEERERVERAPVLQREAQRCKQEEAKQQQQQARYCLYVRGISRSSSDAALKCLFSCFGFMSSLERKHGYCFVVYAEPAAGAIAAVRVPCAAAAAAAAIQYLDGASSGCRGEKHLSVHLAKVSYPLPQQLLSCSSSSSSPRSGGSSSSSRCSCNRCNAALPFDEAAVESAAAAAFIVPRSSTEMPASATAVRAIERQSTEAAATGNEARTATGAAAVSTTTNTASLLRHISTFLSLIHGQQKKLPFMKIAARGRGFAAAKELTESLGVAIAMQSAVKTLSVSLNDVSALVFIPGDGQHPRTAAAVCLQTPPSWRCISIDPRMQQQQQQNTGPPAAAGVPGCRFAGVVEDRIFCFQGRAEAFCIHSLDTILQQQQQKLQPDVVVLLGVHSHAPLQQFFERLLQHYGETASHFVAVSLPCCGSCGFLKAPLVSRYRDPGILSPQNEVYVHHLPSPAAAAAAASSAAARAAAAAATADGRG